MKKAKKNSKNNIVMGNYTISVYLGFPKFLDATQYFILILKKRNSTLEQ